MHLSRWIAPSLWATVLAQSLLTAVVIDAFLRARAATRPTAVWTLAAVLALTLASSVAWFTGLLMSDVFFGLMFLAVVTLVVDPHPGWRAALLLAVIAFARHGAQRRSGQPAAVPGRGRRARVRPAGRVARVWRRRGRRWPSG